MDIKFTMNNMSLFECAYWLIDLFVIIYAFCEKGVAVGFAVWISSIIIAKLLGFDISRW